MTWWVWAVLGHGLLGGEMLTPGGFYFLFFGFGALVTAAIAWAGLGGPAWLEWLLFTVVSLACLVPLRGRLVRWASVPEAPRVDSLVGEEAVILADLDPGAVGKGELRGTTWTVRTAGARTLRRGERARVARVDGLTLWLEA
jgi:membrane protein implicated in regulation of membrane protease activity